MANRKNEAKRYNTAQMNLRERDEIKNNLNYYYIHEHCEYV